MENLIGLVNDLQDAFAGVDERFALELPQIAVVGSQSAGKSSVLENVVGKDFLPRGSGIVTRRPLILQLIRKPDVGGNECGEFLHRRQQQFHDFREIRKEIESETERVCGANKGLSSTPIHLRIYSDRVLDLTLIDLPGMTKVPIGDQPPDIELQIRQLILHFIEQPNCLILAVSPANADLANSDALQMAQEVDPDGLRTIGVLTKLDLMDAGTDARAVLKNELIPLRYGYIGVVNRSQKEIEGQKEINAALRSEEEFFAQHPSYSDMADRMGTAYLRKALHFHLSRHIAESLPDLRSKLESRCMDLERRLAERQLGGENFGDHALSYDDPYWKPKALVMYVIRFAQECRVDLLGNTNDSNLLMYNHLSCGARIHELFHVKYPSMLADIEFAKEVEMKREIGFAIQNIVGVRTAIFTPDKAFDQIIRKQIAKLREPTLQLVQETASEIMKTIDKSLESMKRFPALARYVESLVSNFVLARMEKTRDATNQLLDYEYAYINAKHDDFVGFKHAERTADKIVLERRTPGMQVIKSGWLSLSLPSTLSRSRKHWFVLTLDNFSWYADATLQECKYRIPLGDGRLKFIDYERRNEFSLAGDSEKYNVYKDCNRLDFMAPSFDQFDEWRVGFMRVGVFTSPASASISSVAGKPISGQILDTSDPNLERQIETIWVLIASYMRIVCRTCEDMIPKVIVRALIKDTIEYLEKRFVADVSRLQNIDELLEENSQVVEERRKLQRSYEACRLALEKLRTVHVPKVDGIYYDVHASSKSRATHQRPLIPPRPAIAKADSESPFGAERIAHRSGSVPTRHQQSGKKADDDIRPKRKSTVAVDKPLSVAPSEPTATIAAKSDQPHRGQKTKSSAGKVQKAQSQLDSSQKSTFYIG